MDNSKLVLVTGATGKQGRATISALQSSSKDFHVIALTRNASTPAARSLATGFERVTVVEGDLNSHESIRGVFESWKGKGKDGKGIWGVFAVIAYPGLGVDSAGEELQGKVIAEVAHEYNVSCYIYSSFERAGEIFDDETKNGSTHMAKVRVERRIKELGLPWTILRPTRFMENFEGSMGGLGWSIFSAGLKPTTTLHLIAVEDIGRAAAGVLQDPEPYNKQIMILRGDNLTCPQQAEIYKKATGKNISSVPKIVARGILRVNPHLREMIEFFENTSGAVADGKVPEFESQLELTKKVCPKMTTFEDWSVAVAKGRDSSSAGWNKVSLVSLFTGRH
ncbi:NAD(P)-binding protein [Marasmius fiardii PR-910]|nr:NAD(P)-binding protein [Marasmius fiardii PR-910]